MNEIKLEDLAMSLSDGIRNSRGNLLDLKEIDVMLKESRVLVDILIDEAFQVEKALKASEGVSCE